MKESNENVADIKLPTYYKLDESTGKRLPSGISIEFYKNFKYVSKKQESSPFIFYSDESPKMKSDLTTKSNAQGEEPKETLCVGYFKKYSEVTEMIGGVSKEPAICVFYWKKLLEKF